MRRKEREGHGGFLREGNMVPGHEEKTARKVMEEEADGLV